MKGFQAPYDELHDLTEEPRAVLVGAYKSSNMWIRGYVLGLAMVLVHMERWGGLGKSPRRVYCFQCL